jgi:hypothetical protein
LFDGKSFVSELLNGRSSGQEHHGPEIVQPGINGFFKGTFIKGFEERSCRSGKLSSKRK